jgi:hypothetical protein
MFRYCHEIIKRKKPGMVSGSGWWVTNVPLLRLESGVASLVLQGL